MMKLRVVLPLVLLCALLIPAAASAGPSPISFSISSNAQYVSPTDILVEVTVNCDPSLPDVNVFVSAFESDTGGRGSGSFLTTCSGSAQTVVVLVTGGVFAPGHAYVSGSACAGSFFTPPFVAFCDSADRQVQITL